MTYAVALTVVLAASGCTSDPLAEAYLDGGNENYITGSGISEVAVGDRAGSITFEGVTDTGETWSSEDHVGEVVVVNFWYAGCLPCRDEAPDLIALASDFDSGDVSFVGVNTYDSAETSQAFARNFGVNYPSLLDVPDGAIRLAFAGEIAPKSTPTTFVLDKEGRIASRILGAVPERSILETLIADTIAEP